MTRTLAILAPGLIGGSVARAARAHNAADRITLWARRPEVRAGLRTQPWCDAVADTPEEAVQGAALVVIAAPVDHIVPIARSLARHLDAGAIVTDVGSVKREIVHSAHEALEGRARFVGSHPMAGSEKTGWENASGNLFEKRTCFVTPTPWTEPAAVEAVCAFWKALGANVVTVSPEEHDTIVAHISHLPQLAASALCSFLWTRNPGWAGHAGGGLRDTTRIAGSDPALWRSILEQNRDEVLGALKGYRAELGALEAELEARDFAAVTIRLERGRAYRGLLTASP